MGTEGKLGGRKRRQMERVVGEPLVMAFATYWPYWVGVTPDDRHFWLDRKTGEWDVLDDPLHWTTCPGRSAR